MKTGKRTFTYHYPVGDFIIFLCKKKVCLISDLKDAIMQNSIISKGAIHAICLTLFHSLFQF